MQIVSFGCNRPVKFGMAFSERMAGAVEATQQAYEAAQGKPASASKRNYVEAIKAALAKKNPGDIPDWKLIGALAINIMNPNYHVSKIQRPPLNAQEQDKVIRLMKDGLRDLFDPSAKGNPMSAYHASQALEAWKGLEKEVPDTFVFLVKTVVDDYVAKQDEERNGIS